MQTTIQTLTKSEADALCNRLAQNFDFTIYDDDDDIRIVTVGGLPCPCGGTHVRSTSDLKERGWVVLGMSSFAYLKKLLSCDLCKNLLELILPHLISGFAIIYQS